MHPPLVEAEVSMRASALALLAVLLAACAPTSPPAPAAPAPGAPAPVNERAERQVLRIGGSMFPSNPTPQGGTFFPQYFAPLYDTLTWFGPGFSIVPAVAERWDVSADGLTWTFTLRRDMRWPDGSALTAEDVKFTMDTIFELRWPQVALFTAVAETRVVDLSTVQFVTRGPDMAIPNNAAQLRIVPKAYFQSVGGFDGYLQKPVGSGPYELVEYKPGDITRYRKRAAKHAFRDPPLEEIVFRVIPDTSQLLNGLRLGEIDLVIGNFAADQLEQAQRAGLELLNVEVSSSHINFPYSTYEAKNSPLQDKRVREALNYAVDKEAIARGVYKGFARPVGQMGTPGSPWWDDTVQPWPFNPQRAKQLLAEAGYASGFKVSYDLQPAQLPQELVLAVQSNLRDVGVEMEIIQNDQATFLDKYFGRVQKADLFPLVTGETNGFFQSMRNAYTCQTPVGPGLGIYCNPEFDKLVAEAYGERDAAKRAQLLKQANRLMRSDVPQLWLLTYNNNVLFSKKVRDLKLVTPTQFNFDSVWIAK